MKSIIAGLILMALGVCIVLRPRTFCWFRWGQPTNREPTRVELFVTRVAGVACAITGLVLALLYIFEKTGCSMVTEEMRILIREILTILISLGGGILLLVKPELLARHWRQDPVVLAVYRFAGLLCIVIGGTLVLKKLGISGPF